MSKCHFPHDNYTIILDDPNLCNYNLSLRLIETNHNILNSSILSFSCFDKPNHDQPTLQQLQDSDEEDSLGISILRQGTLEEEESEQSAIRKKKTGCTCKKTNCIKMYCECFSVGKMCTP